MTNCDRIDGRRELTVFPDKVETFPLPMSLT